MSLCQHRDVLPLFSIVVQLFRQLLDERTIHLLQSLLDAQGHRSVVDVLRRQSEVYELLERPDVLRPGVQRVHLLLDEVLHGLHIVVCRLFNLLHPFRILRSEAAVKVPERFKKFMVEALQLWQRHLAERYEVFYLHAHAITYQRIFREVSCQRFRLVSVAAVNRRDGRQCIQFHVFSIKSNVSLKKLQSLFLSFSQKTPQRYEIKMNSPRVCLD